MKFEHLTLRNIDFSDADMRSSTFNFCNIDNCKFDGADMRGLRFDSCNVIMSSIVDVNAKNMTVCQTSIVDSNISSGAISEMEFWYSDIDGKDPSDKK